MAEDRLAATRQRAASPKSSPKVVLPDQSERVKLLNAFVESLGPSPISLYVVNDGKVEERRSGVSPAWSPDGKRLAYKGDFDGNVWVDDYAFPLGVGPDGGVQWTPDGGSLLFEGNGIRLLDVRTGIDRLVAPGTLPALSPDGGTVAYLRYTRSKRTKQRVGSRLEIVQLAGGQSRVIARTHGPEYGPHFESRPQWLPDGTAFRGCSTHYRARIAGGRAGRARRTPARRCAQDR